MAEIIPFKGLLFNPDKITNIADVVTPPYDIIDEREHKMYMARHPYNVIRLDLSKNSRHGLEQDSSCLEAATELKSWVKNQILVQDNVPCYYLTSVEFEKEGKKAVRYGLIAQVKLEPFSKKVVLPHEKTYSKVKSERLELMKACHANFSPVFSIFSDDSNIFGILINQSAGTPPVFDFKDDAGHRHKLWRIADAQIQKKVSDNLREKKLFIADGHHRYETALNYRNWLLKQNPNLPPAHRSNYIMMYLCSVQDHDLVILPAHRLMSDISISIRQEFLHKADAYFTIQKFSYAGKVPEKVILELRKAMSSNPTQHNIGVFIKDNPDYFILTLKPGVMDQFFENIIEPSLRELDVTVLTRLILIHLLGLTDEDLDSEKEISFTSDYKDAVTAVSSGHYDMAFILNPTTNEQVLRVAEHGLCMPRKSTYFYPKALTGMVMNILSE